MLSIRLSSPCLLPLVRDRELHELEPEQVVHVHALGPALLVPDLGLVLQVANDLGLARKSPASEMITLEELESNPLPHCRGN